MTVISAICSFCEFGIVFTPNGNLNPSRSASGRHLGFKCREDLGEEFVTDTRSRHNKFQSEVMVSKQLASCDRSGI